MVFRIDEFKSFFFNGKFAIFLFILCVFIRYYLPEFVSIIFFFGLLFVYAISKNDWFWIPFFLLLISAPGYLFNSGGTFHLPAINVSFLGRNIFFEELFAFITIIKSLFNRNKVKPFCHRNLLIIIVYAFFLLLVSTIYGVSILKLLRTIRFLIPLLLFWAVPKLLDNEFKIYQTLNLFYLFLLICFTAQIVDIVTGNPVASYLGESQLNLSGNQTQTQDKIFDTDSGPVRTIYGIFITLISLVTSLYYSNQRFTIFNKYYLTFIAFLSYISVFFSATRGWIIGYSFIILSYLLMSRRNISHIIFSSAIVFSLFLFLSPLKTQLDNVLTRISTIESLFQGDLTASGTLSRLTDRGPAVMKKFKESPVIGFGFSDEYFIHQDGHVGNQNLLLNGGVIGLFLFLLLIIQFLKISFISGKHLNKNIWLFPISMIALVIIHSSSRQIFSFLMNVETALGLSIFFMITKFEVLQEKIKNISILPTFKDNLLS